MILILVYDGGDIVKIFVDKDEISQVDEWSFPILYFMSEYVVMALVTLFLIVIPLWAGIRMFSRVRMMLRARNNAQQNPFNILRQNFPPNLRQNFPPNPPQNLPPNPPGDADPHNPPQ